MSCRQYSLKIWNTFGINAYANNITIADSIDTILSCRWKQSVKKNEPTLLLGEGSNVLFLHDFHGHVFINRIKGISVTEVADAWLLHIGAGESWHQLVRKTLIHGLAGLENLALIPGRVGSAPIQNIGAYGVDFATVCEYVDIMFLTDYSQKRLYVHECCFGYRKSVFKNTYKNGYVITAVGLRLKKNWQPVLSYSQLRHLDPKTVTPREVYQTVCAMRRSKIPDPKHIGNAGSFFKNPSVTMSFANDFLTQHPTIPYFLKNNGEIMLSAGGLIDHCALKGYRVGGAAVYDKQALVLINTGGASGQDIINLARFVRRRVAEEFNVWLEPEVCFISSQGEIDPVEVIV
ncbi:UDP-N-acetylenolpyruvoylglucosamine reductase [Candidatus Erwinia haradaeae]|uniref:UDP-N-acetylenolpyruvoylglucosamine reductase n=1 Tax=Candidatus Erwinia haradaeae TaxID=1922217 RepID=A0A451DCV0_9GAMM|nr:UDP-N-acetylmuramate dehydrogenase [Candidatus Erwinia haradaeae]VFP84243.1 UDP-N-acetylenolpyruvoylglucosamine reductase [Candidatus Erwinia haradaeae]